jgi:hypothetical protein
MPPGHSHSREELGQNQSVYCRQEGHWKNECLQWARDSQKAPRLETEARPLKENISPPTREPAPGRKTMLVWQAWKAMRKTRTDQTSFYWAPRSLWSK